ncbi:hypothetical protein G3570_02325 [Balneolaceae bacterium YR4-1]|uniref:Uncharacterized protein n=1 Tax=Halalkalibaculum roseum TaxID=2709311 RepID=A0A6M1SRS3_9BACT|nr:hypothetical protein [Halalkalibaculum roseum]NGP75452.1 hypothetical protein [Halalkalibaculum roseum]
MITGCEANLDPIDRGAGVYGIYGALDLNSQTNYIRVKDLNAELTAEATNTLNATVTLENLETGEIDTLSSNRLQFEDIYLHNFVVNQPVSPDTPYSVTAKRSDGAQTSIETLTPTQPVPVAGPQNQACNTPVTVSFEPTNGGTIVIRLGIPFESVLGPIYWATPQELREDTNAEGRITYTFTPQIQVSLIPGSVTNGQDLDCTDLDDDDFLISYAHYSRDFYEKIENDPFDIRASTQRFGSYYRDTLAVAVDISQ